LKEAKSLEVMNTSLSSSSNLVVQDADSSENKVTVLQLEKSFKKLHSQISSMDE